MAEPGPETLTNKQAAFLAALLQTPSIISAAKQAGISEKHAYRLLKLDPFREVYRDRRRLATEAACARLSSEAGQAVDVLAGVMNNPIAPTSSRVAAAGKIIDSAIRAAELDDLAERLEAVEEAMAAIHKEAG